MKYTFLLQFFFHFRRITCVDLKVFLEAIRECTDLKELTPTMVNTLIKRIDVHNSEKDENGVKYVPIDFPYRSGNYQYSYRKGTDCGNGRNTGKVAENRLKQRKTV